MQERTKVALDQALRFGGVAIERRGRHTGWRKHGDAKVAGDQPLEFIMKDTHTVEHHPERLTRWVQIAYEEIDRYLSTDRRPL